MLYRDGGEKYERSRAKCLECMRVFAMGNAATIVYMASMLYPKIDFSLQRTKDLVWSFFEFEEGREIAGLILLLLHVTRLMGFLVECRLIPKATTWITFFMIGGIFGAVYRWVYYQPEMNARYNSEHCDGAFGVRGEKSIEL